MRAKRVTAHNVQTGNISIWVNSNSRRSARSMHVVSVGHSRNLPRLKGKHGDNREQSSLSFLGISLYGDRLVLRVPTGIWSEILEPHRCRVRDRAWDDGYWDGTHVRACWPLSS